MTNSSPSSLGITHPLSMLSAAEVEAARKVLVREGHLDDTVRVANIFPVEPSREVIARHVESADDFERRVRITLITPTTAASSTVLVNITRGSVEEVAGIDFATDGQPQYLFEEYERVAGIVKGHEQWQQAMARRGITDTTHTFVAPLAPGFFPREDEENRRVIRSLTFHRFYEGDNPWAHPVEGLICHVDLTEGRVIRLEDVDEVVPIPRTDWHYVPEKTGPARTSLKPLEIVQPEGPSFTVDDNLVRWENWSMRVGFTQQEGLVLHQITFRDGDEERSVVHRASVPEMVVPYGDTTPTRFWISYFDAGEYCLGKNANSLKLGCDCLGVIKYFDATIADEDGHASTIPHAICMHEEDYGVLWKHTEFGEEPQVRRSRRLVLSYFATIGNYEYGFFYYFYLDGSIEVEAKATGIVFTGACLPGQPNRHSNEIAPGIMAPVHQHIFCARLDMAVDGFSNTVEEEEVVGIPTGPENPWGNAFTWTRRALTHELEAVRDGNSETGRKWVITNPNRKNAVGQPTGYVLLPETGPRLLAQEGSSVWKRAQFATHHLWVTQYDADEVFPAGPMPNQHAGHGLGEWVKADRSIDNTDLVVWHTFGPTHVPRPEDWPVMPVDYYGFWLKPYGFLDANPALDLPNGAKGEVPGCCSTDVDLDLGGCATRPAVQDDCCGSRATGCCGEGEGTDGGEEHAAGPKSGGHL